MVVKKGKSSEDDSLRVIWSVPLLEPPHLRDKEKSEGCSSAADGPCTVERQTFWKTHHFGRRRTSNWPSAYLTGHC